MPVTDEEAALQAIATLEKLSDEQQDALAQIRAILDDGEPFVDVHKLVALYNVLYFRQLLLPRVEVLWSPRLTLCAGICELSKDPSTGKFTRIRLKLSTPLLQYRPRSDIINTLLHEAIHAYFFITTSWRHSRGDDGTGHGAGFLLLADAVNNHGNYNVTVYHTFHDEVESYRTHVWQCDGACKSQPPFFGLVKRSMNRTPGKSDPWWEKHQIECGGTYTKIMGPAPTKKQIDAMSAKGRAGRQKNKLDDWITAKSTPSASQDVNAVASPGQEQTQIATSATSDRKRKIAAISHSHDSSSTDPFAGRKKMREDERQSSAAVKTQKSVECPICAERVSEMVINEHLDIVHV